MRAAVVMLGVVVGAGTAHADEAAAPAPRPLRWSIGGGGALVVTGEGERPRNRLDGHVEVMPGGRFGRWGVLAAARQIVLDPLADDAMLTLGVVHEAAASRPRLTLALHGDVGLAVADRAPVLGGGVETHLWIVPKLAPVALVLDVTAHLVLDGVDDTRLTIAAATRLAIAM